MLTLWCVPAQAQLEFPDRAAALRPSGMVESSTTWGMARTDYSGTDFVEEHLLVFALDARIPIESLILEVSILDAISVVRVRQDAVHYEGTYNALGNPRIGASWHHADHAGLRAEIGGALNIPYLATQSPEPLRIDVSPEPPIIVPPPRQHQRHRGGWSAFQLEADRFAVMAHARVELDLAPEVVIGGELDLPLVARLDRSEVMFLPQLSLEGAFRFLQLSLIGLRAQATVVHPLTHYGLVVLLEPFLRVVQLVEDVAAFGTLSVPISVGPDSLPSDNGPSPTVFAGLKVGGGVLF